MSSFDMNTRPETFVPLFHCIIDDTLSQVMPNLRQMLLQFIDVMNLMSVSNFSMHASMPKEDIIAFNVTEEYFFLSFIAYSTSTGALLCPQCRHSSRVVADGTYGRTHKGTDVRST